MKAIYYWYALAGCCALAGCQQEQAKTAAATTVNIKPVLQAPFRFHKMIEVAPGQDYDILSWGRGLAETGAYMILRSDSVDKKYTTTTGDLDGKIVDVFNTDMDTDGNPEIYVQSQTADSTGYNKIDAYEYNDNDARKLDFPKLTSKQRKGYHGGDDFVMKEDKLIRTFPVYDSDNKNAKPTGQKRTLEYSYHGNSFSVKQISTDSTTVTPASNKTEAAAQPTKTESSGNTRHQSSGSGEHHSSHRHESRHESRHHEVSRHRKAAHHEESSRRRRRHRR